MDHMARGMSGKARRALAALRRKSQQAGPGAEQREAPPPTDPTPMPETYDATDAAAELMVAKRINPMVVAGTGTDGRIVKKDVDAYLAAKENG